MSALIINFRPNDGHEWKSHAACSDPQGPDMFPDPSDNRGIRDAKNVCAVCPVRFECLSSALDNSEPHGVWGGLTTDERRSARIASTKRSRAAQVPHETAEQVAAVILDAEAEREAAQAARTAAEREAAAEAERKEAARKVAEAYGQMLDAASEYVNRMVTA